MLMLLVQKLLFKQQVSNRYALGRWQERNPESKVLESTTTVLELHFRRVLVIYFELKIAFSLYI